ncbi:MAG: SusC/RagA family TonB-linked outer membrane protein [Bacteroidetes bacterium]|nr:SusC/RagA family TonB-linked outer membrane protein [Bacteroidota bacterium]
MSLKKVTRCTLALLLISLQHTLLLAQQAPTKLINGKVVNETTKEPMRGVSVNLKGSTKGTTTDDLGAFDLQVPAGPGSITLVFSYVGYDTKEIKTDGNSAITIGLQSNNKKMDDVVVIGYGTQKRSNILGSVAVINPKEVVDLPAANLSTLLVNQVPGVGISQSAGKPGASTSLSIRGATTFAGLVPNALYIIDGLAPIISTGTSVDPTGKTAFDNLDPSQIESITILKDASATIYGARGANGVILVTTKKGRPGKPRINYAGSYSTEDAAKKPRMISGLDQANLLNDWVRNYPTNPNNIATTELFTPVEMDSIRAHNYNWFNQVWKPASIQKHTVSVSGGTEKLTYFAGVNYYDEIGNLTDVTQTKYGIQLGMTANIVEGLRTEISVNSNNAINNRPAPKGTPVSEQSDQMNATVGGLLSVPGWVPMYVDGNPYYYTPLNWHPAALAASGSYAKDKQNSFSLNASIEYKIPVIKGLSLRAQYGRNTFNDFAKQYYPSYLTYDYVKSGVHKNPGISKLSGTGTQNVILTPTFSPKTITNSNQLAEITSMSSNWQATEGITYANRFGDHDFSVMVLSEQSQNTGDYLTTQASTQVIPGVDQVFGFNTGQGFQSFSGQSTSTGRVSYLGRLTYAFKGKYLLEGSFRDDASPNFPTERQWGFFPAGSVGWKISEENFFQNHVHFLNDLKMRFNFGLTGNDATSAFGFVQRYTPTNGYLFGNSNFTNGLNSTSIANSQITWERAFFKDLGFDGTFANRKFNFTLDYWNKHQYDMLEAPTASVPNVLGATVANQNHGILNSWGIEAQIGYNQDITRDIRVFATVNFSWSDNKVISRYYSPGTDTGYKYPIGKRADRGISGYKATGIVKTKADADAWNAKHPKWLVNGDTLRAGDLNFEDINGDGFISDLDQTQIASRSSNLFGMGFNFGVQWKSLRFSTNISLGVGGQMTWAKADITPPTKDARSLEMWKDAYTANNTNAALPAIYAPLANQASTFWLRSATYMYINNMQLSYAVPVSWTTAHHLPEVRAYITGINLWTLINPTPFKDPRSNQTTDYPILRSWTFGLNLNL